MNQGKYIFAQIMEFVPRSKLDLCVKRYKGNRRVRQFSCRDQLLTVVFGQLTHLKSLRSIITCLNAHSRKFYHLGLGTKALALSTVAKANEQRDWRIYRDLADALIVEARKLYVNDPDFSGELDGTVYALDSTIIELCLSIFPWAQFEQTTAAVKIHTQMDLRGNIPSFFHITRAKTHDIHFLDIVHFEPGAYYIMDRGYVDFERLFAIQEQRAFFIVRAKMSLSASRIYSRIIDKATGLRCDQVIHLNNFYSRKAYPERLRRIKYHDVKTHTTYVYLTNNFAIDALAVADLYKQRWQIELFFKWIKQHLRIQVFWGHSVNAVKIHICIAICTFLLVAILKKRLGIKRDLHEILHILHVSQFDKLGLKSLLSESNLQIPYDESPRQAKLSGF